MTDLDTILKAIDEMPVHELEQVKQHIEQRQENILIQNKSRSPKEIEQIIDELDAALAAFREGLTQEEWDATAKIMNEEYIEPEDSSLFAGDDIAGNVT